MPRYCKQATQIYCRIFGTNLEDVSMKMTLTVYADDVTALVEALEQAKQDASIGITVGGGATDEWAYDFDVIDNGGLA